MSDQVVIPPSSAAATGYVVTHEGHNDRGHGNHHNDSDWPERTAERVRGQLADFERAVVPQVNAVSVAVEKTGAAGQLSTNVAAQQIQNTQLQNFNLASVQAQTFAAATNLAIEKIGAAAELSRALGVSEIQRKAAECCCELKELIREEAGKTRELMSAIQASNLAINLADAKAEILALKAAAK